MDLTIIILSYKSKKYLAALLPTIFASQTKFSYEVIVVDNDSRDGTAEWLQTQIRRSADRQISLIQNQNTGFASGNNLGLKKARGRYVLLLNPDTRLQPDTLETMLVFMEARPDVGISGCKILKPDGKLDLACRRRFPNPWNSFQRLFLLNNKDYNYADIDENQSMAVDSVVGAFLLIRKSVLDKIGLLDEQFFMYGEDLDWCWRCKQAGFLVWYYPQTFIWHDKGASSRKIPFKMLRAFHDAMWIFYRKHYARRSVFFLNWLVYIGIYLRLTVLLIVNALRPQPRVSR